MTMFILTSRHESNVLPGVVNWASTIGWVAFNNVFGATALKLIILHQADLGFIVAFAVAAVLYRALQRRPATLIPETPR
jgi:purine-cytosine permease-like protein